MQNSAYLWNEVEKLHGFLRYVFLNSETMYPILFTSQLWVILWKPSKIHWILWLWCGNKWKNLRNTLAMNCSISFSFFFLTEELTPNEWVSGSMIWKKESNSPRCLFFLFTFLVFWFTLIVIKWENVLSNPMTKKKGRKYL